MDELKVVAVRGGDWTFYEDQRDCDEVKDCELVPCWTVSILVHEDKEKIAIAGQYFPSSDDVRHTMVIPKADINERIDMRVIKPNKSRVKK